MKAIKSPRSLYLDITSDCNLRCRYCYHFASPGHVTQDLPTWEWLNFFQELGQCAVMHVTLTGGEPFLRRDLEALINGIVSNGMRFRILSNGTLITDDLASYIRETGRCDDIQVSIDGGNSGIHDLSRGKGNFERAISGIRTLQAHRIRVSVRVTINRYNVRNLEQIAQLLLDDLGLPSFSTNSTDLLGLCRINEQALRLTVEDRQLAMATLLKLDAKYNGRITANAGPLAEAKQWGFMEEARKQGGELMPNGGFLSACGGVNTNMAVRADGIMTPCTLMSHVELGRINEDSIIKVWQTHPELQRLRERAAIPLTELDYCKDCEYVSYCTGYCPASAHSSFGNDKHPSPDSCLRLFLESGGRVPGPIHTS